MTTRDPDNLTVTFGGTSTDQHIVRYRFGLAAPDFFVLSLGLFLLVCLGLVVLTAFIESL